MPQTSATNERQIKDARERQRKDAETSKNILTVLMANPEGRRWIWNQLAFARVFQPEENLDPQVLAFSAGRRNTGLKLLGEVTRFAPDHYILMTREQSGVELNGDPDGGDADDPSGD